MYHKDLPMWLWRAMKQRTEEPATWSLTIEDMEIIERLAGENHNVMKHLAMLAKRHGDISRSIALSAINKAKKA